MNQSYENSVSWLTTACGCPFPQTSLSPKLSTRVAEAGFEIAFDPPADGKCFCYAASFQIGFSATILTSLIFEYSFIIPYKIGMTLTISPEGAINKKLKYDSLRCPTVRIKYCDVIHLVPMLLFLFLCECKYNK